MKIFIERVLEVYRPFKGVVALIFFLVMCVRGLSLLSPYIHGQILDSLIEKEELSRVMFIVLLAFLAYLAETSVSYIREKIEINYIDFAASKRLMQNTFHQVCGYSLGQHINHNSGIKQSIMREGESALINVSEIAFYQLIPMTITVVITSVILTCFNWLLGLIMVVGIISYLVIAVRMNYRFKDDLKKNEDMRHEVHKVRGEFLKNIALVKIHAQEEKATKEFTKAIDVLHEFSKDLWIKFLKIAVGRNIILGLTRFLILSIGVYQVYQGQYTPGFLVVLLGWSTRTLGNLEYFGHVHRKIVELNASVNKYFTLKEVQSDIQVVQNPVIISTLRGQIEFRDVNFTYPIRRYIQDDNGEETPKQQHRTLQNVDLKIEAGQKVAFVGHSGAGKTTAMALILRAYDPDTGRIMIDGEDLRLLDPEQYLQRIGVVEQEVELFDEKLRYNILFGLNGKAQDITEQDLERIAELARLDQFFNRLEDGFDTLIGENGIKLSGGERQRVGIARALIKQPKILILDEATSNLDAENEALIRDAINRASKGRTTIIIAHRFSTIKDVDQIFVFDEGRIVGQGVHSSLIENCSTYQSLIKNQVTTF